MYVWELALFSVDRPWGISRGWDHCCHQTNNGDSGSCRIIFRVFYKLGRHQFCCKYENEEVGGTYTRNIVNTLFLNALFHYIILYFVQGFYKIFKVFLSGYFQCEVWAWWLWLSYRNPSQMKDDGLAQYLKETKKIQQLLGH